VSWCRLLSVEDHTKLVENVDGTEHEPHDDAALSPSTKPKAPDVNLTSLQSVLQTVNDGPPSLPSICLYKLQNTHQGFVAHRFCAFQLFSFDKIDAKSVR